MKRIMAIYDEDSNYAEQFADFVNQKEKTPFIVMAFTSSELLRQFSKEHPLEILLIGSEIQKELTDDISVSQIVILTDGEKAPFADTYPGIFKYQPTDHIIREVLSCYCDQPDLEPIAASGKRAKVMGVYSPIHRCLKTSFALTIGQLLAKEHKVLYLNLEEYSGFTKLLDSEHNSNLSDLLYFYQQKRYSLVRLNSLTHTWGDLDYIPPVHYPEDLCQITGEEFAGLVFTIASDSVYEIIIIDTGPLGRQVLPVLEQCSIVYMPVKEDPVSMAKIEEFREYLECSGKQKLLERVQQIKLPYHNNFGRRDNYMEQLLWSELGDYVRALVKGQVWSQ